MVNALAEFVDFVPWSYFYRRVSFSDCCVLQSPWPLAGESSGLRSAGRSFLARNVLLALLCNVHMYSWQESGSLQFVFAMHLFHLEVSCWESPGFGFESSSKQGLSLTKIKLLLEGACQCGAWPPAPQTWISKQPGALLKVHLNPCDYQSEPHGEGNGFILMASPQRAAQHCLKHAYFVCFYFLLWGRVMLSVRWWVNCLQ